MGTKREGLDIERHRIDDSAILEKLRNSFLEIHKPKYEQGFFETEAGEADIVANIRSRYNHALDFVVPWVGNVTQLAGKEMVEIGCGTGSSTAAFSHFVEQITGYDIDIDYVEFARQRFTITGVENAVANLVGKDTLCSKLRENHANGADIILLYAVLEHQTIEERLETISTCWELLRPNGLMVITDTPNLLIYNDFHTSLLPFLHFLPDQTYKLYSKNSPREGFNRFFEQSDYKDPSELNEAISRWGRGVSFHDFELALGPDYAKNIVANGYEEQILNWISVGLEEELLMKYIESIDADIPIAFSRVHLNFIMQKGGPPVTNLPTPPEPSFIIDMSKYAELKQQHDNACHELSLVLQSKRWKLGNLVAWPYRRMKNFFTGHDER